MLRSNMERPVADLGQPFEQHIFQTVQVGIKLNGIAEGGEVVLPHTPQS